MEYVRVEKRGYCPQGREEDWRKVGVTGEDGGGCGS